MHDLESLWSERVVEERKARDVAAGTVEARHKAKLDWIISCREDHGNSRDRHRHCRRSAGRGNHTHLAANQIGCEVRQPIVLTLRPAVLDRKVLALEIAAFTQTLAERENRVTRY